LTLLNAGFFISLDNSYYFPNNGSHQHTYTEYDFGHHPRDQTAILPIKYQDVFLTWNIHLNSRLIGPFIATVPMYNPSHRVGETMPPPYNPGIPQ